MTYDTDKYWSTSWYIWGPLRHARGSHFFPVTIMLGLTALKGPKILKEFHPVTTERSLVLFTFFCYLDQVKRCCSLIIYLLRPLLDRFSRSWCLPSPFPGRCFAVFPRNIYSILSIEVFLLIICDVPRGCLSSLSNWFGFFPFFFTWLSLGST